MAKKTNTYNFGQEMRQLIVKAHNRGNTKAINKDNAIDENIDPQFLTQWIFDVRVLQGIVNDYVTKKKNANVDKSITEGDVYAARERIFPKWKEILRCAETTKYSKDLHVAESDIEDLYSYAVKFMPTSRGTVETFQTDMMFRKAVESLLGCRIAGNMVLTPEKRDVLDAYYKASKTIENCITQIASLEAEKKNWTLMVSDKTSEDLRKLVDIKVHEIDDAIKLAQERKTAAEAKEREHSTSAKNIEAEIRLASSKPSK